MTYSRKFAAALAASVCVIAVATPAQAQVRQYNIAAGSLKSALDAYARQSGRQIIYKVDEVRSARSGGAKGSMSADDALDAILAGSGFTARKDPSGALAIVRGGAGNATTGAEPQRGEADAGSTAADNEGAEILVTGSRIRGAPVAAPVISVTRTQMADAGQNDLGEVVRSIPQNFAGGQNPGAGSRPGTGSGNGSGGSSTLNLRGIGNDATLTLLNGHRLASNGNSGVDITAIPIEAVDRLEIVADGSSALYGADAVGGVANIITRSNFSGVTASATIGGSTDGGFEQRQASLVAGTSGSSGNILGAVNYRRNSAIYASQRSYTSGMTPETTLYPALRRINGFVSGQLRPAPGVKLTVDALYSSNHSYAQTALTTAPLASSGSISRPRSRSFLIAPSIEINLTRDWRLTAYGTYARDEARGNVQRYSAGVLTRTTTSCFCNDAYTAELSAEGPLFTLPAGAVRVAAGTGYRSNSATVTVFNNGIPAPASAFADRESMHYVFGELSVPIVSSTMGVPLVHRLHVSAALRHEDYESFGSVATPKVGLIWEVTPQFTISSSWGKSFKAPLFYQTAALTNTYLVSVTGYGSQFPAGSTFIYTSGGNRDLKPERANTFTLSAELKPAAGLTLSASYYRIDFRDRVVTPFFSTAGVITNPTYTSFVIRNPSPAQQASYSALAPAGLVSLITVPYDPAKVVAILDGRYANAAVQKVDGIDFSVSYRFTLGQTSHVSLSSSATLLNISQQLIPGEPTVDVTGAFYQPRHFRLRGGATWQRGSVSLSGFVGHVDGATFTGATSNIKIAPVTTVDLTGRWLHSPLLGFDIALTGRNIFNSKPTVVPGQIYETSFDATAYAVTGRELSLTLSRSF